MNRTRPYLNRFVKQKELEMADVYHDIKMREIKPITTKLMEHAQTFTINHSKREMIKEARETEIERENKVLLGKLESVICKKGLYSVAKTKSINTKASKSLNEIFRKKQLENIQLQNKQLLTRLHDKRATLDTIKLKKDWENNKNTIKRMANCEFNLAHFKIKEKGLKSIKSQRISIEKLDSIKISKFKVIDGFKILIKMEVVDNVLKIIGDLCDHKDLKVIEIPKEEAFNIIDKLCEGRLEKLLDSLKYDRSTGTLFISFQNQDESDLNPQQNKIQYKNSKNKSIKMHHMTKSSLEQGPLANESKELQFFTINHEKAEHQSHQTIDKAKRSLKSSHKLKIQSVDPEPKQVFQSQPKSKAESEEENYGQQQFDESHSEVPPVIQEKNSKQKERIVQPEVQKQTGSEVKGPEPEQQDYNEDFQQNQIKSSHIVSPQ